MIVSEPRRGGGRARLLAIVAAVAMIGGAWAIRSQVIENDDENDTGSGGQPNGETKVVCIPELADACRTLDADVVIEPAGVTAAKLTALEDNEPADIDAWVTYEPWMQLVRDTRARAGLDEVVTAGDGVLGRTPLAVAARRDRADVLLEACGGELTWRCIGDAAGKPWSGLDGQETWGAVRPAHGDPTESATGLLTLGHAVGSYLATPEIAPDDVSRLDWETSDEFPGWFQGLERAIPTDAFSDPTDPFVRWLQTRPVGARYDVVATTQAAADTALGDAAPDVRDAATVLYPAPVATADVVLAPIGDGGRAGELSDDLRPALVDAGYRTGVGGDPPLPETDNLPSAGALQALRGLWGEVVN